MDEDRQDRDGVPSRLDDLGAYIRHQRESARLSLRKLATLAGVSNPYLSQIERGLRKPSAEILQAIAKALEISSETLYVKAGILEERELTEDLPTVIARDPYLTGPQRQALLEMYRSFRQLSELSAERDTAGTATAEPADRDPADRDPAGRDRPPPDPDATGANLDHRGDEPDPSTVSDTEDDPSVAAFGAGAHRQAPRSSRRQRLLDRVSVGDIDDDAVQAASHPEEDAGMA